ncbi:MAG: hypothetical protein AAF604_22270 [Acidobacteriota bacterium]
MLIGIFAAQGAAWAQTPSEGSPAHIEIRTLRNQLKRVASAIAAGDLENQYRVENVVRDIRRARASVDKVRAKDPDFDISSEIAELEKLEQKVDGGVSELNQEENLGKLFLQKTHLFSKLTIDHGFHGNYDFRRRGADYLGVAQQFDTTALRAKIREASAYAEGTFYELKSIRQFLEVEYPEFAEGRLKPVVDRHIEEAYGQLDDQPAAALDYARAAVQVSDAVLAVLPGNSTYTRLRSDAGKALQAAEVKVQKDVLTSPFHRQHQRRIVFANRPIAVGGEGSAGIKDRFLVGETIHARAYLDRKLKGLSRATEARIEVYLDDNRIYSEKWYLPSARGEDSSLDLEIIPAPALRRHRHGVAITSGLVAMSPRNHRLRVVLKGGPGSSEWAVGELELDGSAGVAALARQSRVLNDQLLAEVELPKAAMRNARLEQEMVRLAGQRLSAPWSVDRVIIRDRDWRIDRHPATGVIVRRLLSTWVVMRSPDRCRMISMSFAQASQGGSSYGRTEDYGVGESKDIGCDKLR